MTDAQIQIVRKLLAARRAGTIAGLWIDAGRIRVSLAEGIATHDESFGISWDQAGRLVAGDPGWTRRLPVKPPARAVTPVAGWEERRAAYLARRAG